MSDLDYEVTDLSTIDPIKTEDVPHDTGYKYRGNAIIAGTENVPHVSVELTDKGKVLLKVPLAFPADSLERTKVVGFFYAPPKYFNQRWIQEVLPTLPKSKKATPEGDAYQGDTQAGYNFMMRPFRHFFEAVGMPIILNDNSVLAALDGMEIYVDMSPDNQNSEQTRVNDFKKKK